MGSPTEDDEILDARYVRWQSIAIAQLTVAIGLISAWAAGAMVYGISLLRSVAPQSCERWWLFGALGTLFIASALSFFAVLSRTLDFKLTARVVRKKILEKRGAKYTKATTILGLSKEAYGRLTWVLFIGSAVLFSIGMSAFSICICVQLLEI